MQLVFYKGCWEFVKGQVSAAHWCSTPLGIRVLQEGSQQPTDNSSTDPVISSEIVASFELPGLDWENVKFIIDSILLGDYLTRPGVAGREDAVLYIMVNEALSALDIPV
jgi:hypothetical protein